MVMAYRLGNKHLPTYASVFSRHDFTLPQLFACLVLRQFYNLSYRRAQALLADCPDLRQAIELSRTPDHNTLCDAFETLVRAETFAPMLDELATAFEDTGLLALDTEPVAIDSTYFESHHVSRHFEKRKRQTAAKSGLESNDGESNKTESKTSESKKKSVEPAESAAEPAGGKPAGQKTQPKDKGGSATRTDTVKKLPKLAIAVAVACHLILSLWTGTGAGADHPHLEELAFDAWRRVGVKTFVADAGYDGESSHELIRDDMTCQSIIPPSIGRPTDKPPATHYRALMARLLADDPKVQAAYGQRWQVETVNSMLKRNYGSALRAATPERREREMMLKVLVHNMALAIL